MTYMHVWIISEPSAIESNIYKDKHGQVQKHHSSPQCTICRYKMIHREGYYLDIYPSQIPKI